MEKKFEDGISKCLCAFNYDDEYGNKVDVLSTYDENGVNYNIIIENGMLAGRSIMVEIKDGYNFHNLYISFSMLIASLETCSLSFVASSITNLSGSFFDKSRKPFLTF